MTKGNAIIIAVAIGETSILSSSKTSGITMAILSPYDMGKAAIDLTIARLAIYCFVRCPFIGILLKPLFV